MAACRNQVVQTSPLFKLPPELFAMVNDYLNYADAVCLSLTCHELRAVEGSEHCPIFARPVVRRLDPRPKIFKTRGDISPGARDWMTRAYKIANDHFTEVNCTRDSLLPRLKTWMNHGFSKGQKYCHQCSTYWLADPATPPRQRICTRCRGLHGGCGQIGRTRRWLSHFQVWLQRYDRDKERLEKEEISEKRWKANMKRTESTAEYWVYGPSETGPAQLYGGIVEAEDQPESTTLD